jgi:signal transduction histidine kinase
VADLTSDPLVIAGDLFALGRVYRNLVVNAMQATPAGGRVTVTSRHDRERDRVQVMIGDTGCGIEADRLTGIFDEFTTTKRRGLGLGLAIAKKIVGELDGTIAVMSAVGVGTTFTLEFPSAPAADVAVAG